MHLPVLLALSLALIASSNALRVAPNSPCLSVCGDATLTDGSDIVCDDTDFANTPTGRAFQECISCELNSTAYDTVTGQTDLQWLLYNLRYELSWCVWGFPNATNIGNSPCTTSFACAFFQDSIEVDNLSPNASTFEYCTAGFNTEDIIECHNCLLELNTELYLANFFTVLEAGCSQKPFNGQILTLSGSVFSTTPIQIVNASSVVATFHGTQSGPLSLGAKVGIAVGGIVLLLICTGCFIVCRGKRRRRAFLAAQNHRNQNMMEQQGMGPYGVAAMETGAGAEADAQRNTPSPPMPPSLQTRNFEWQRPDKYPTSSPEDGSATEKFFPRYSSLYSSPVSGSEGPGSAITMNQVQPWAAGGLGDKEDGKGRMEMVREAGGDEIELQRMERRRGAVVEEGSPQDMI